MCLYHSEKIEIAKEDIPCYKITKRDLISLYYDFQYEVGKEFDLGRNLEYEIDNPSRSISHGFHSYIYNSRNSDIYTILSYITLSRSVYTMLKCIIPKGAQYSIGVDGQGIDCYVSNKIKVIESIKIIRR